MVQQIKNPPTMQETRRHGFDPWIRKIPWRKKMATHSSIIAWEVPWTEKTSRLQSMGLQRVRHNQVTERVIET